MNENVVSRIAEYAESGWSLESQDDYDVWQRRVLGFISGLGDNHLYEMVANLGDVSRLWDWQKYRDQQASFLESLALQNLPSRRRSEGTVNADGGARGIVVNQKNRVFVVHGHDSEAKESVARFLEKLDLEPIVLHEKPNEGKTVIEKFELHSNVGFAVVLLTPDDIGSGKSQPNDPQPRARQNVILELGYFVAKLGRKGVCALHKPGVEIPSDFQGVLYVPFDDQGAWQRKLAQELVSAGIEISVDGLLH